MTETSAVVVHLESWQPTPKGIQVELLVADECVRHGLAVMLNSLAMVDGVHLWGSVDFAPRVAAAARDRAPDLLILRYGDLDADATQRLARDARERGTKVLLLLHRDHEDTLDGVITVPSNGFIVQEDLTSASLAAAITRVTDGETPMPTMLADRLLSRARESVVRPAAAGSNLTPRERQVLELLVEGLSNKQIARRLTISPHGVKRLVSNVLAKLNCPTRTHAVAVALTDGILAGA
ncbi:response regulator transcription factor [Micromonospora sp. PLK6-60]|uniref:helix-turn-helix transcriptional regulator n=1 Tax=Micromonospora sp. PLK6-60 TaxID=2873383 RepID=UPI001CA735D1|nr:response regulator transcription factor [Micromonospora sp. PLK6-60]MBY8870792.1 response regulator transcription factor [Micromonospora sp. PLK6-60]